MSRGSSYIDKTPESHPQKEISNYTGNWSNRWVINMLEPAITKSRGYFVGLIVQSHLVFLTSLGLND